MIDLLKRSCHTAGGLRLDKPDLTLAVSGENTSDLQAPPYIDNRSILLPADNQGPHPHCAAYAMATVIEVALWKKTRKRVTIDPLPIYAQAKLLDGDNNPGTYLDSVFKAAQKLNIIGPQATMRALRTRSDVKFAIREFEICLLGFNITAGWNTANKRTGFIGPETEKLGGHAVVGCWYCDKSVPEDGVGIGNSWDVSWAASGFGRMSWRQFDDQFMYGLVVENL